MIFFFLFWRPPLAVRPYGPHILYTPFLRPWLWPIISKAHTGPRCIRMGVIAYYSIWHHLVSFTHTFKNSLINPWTSTLQFLCLYCIFSLFFRYIFAQNMFELGCINSAEWTVYQDWHTFLVEQFGPKVQLEGIIYLRASPQVWSYSFPSVHSKSQFQSPVNLFYSV